MAKALGNDMADSRLRRLEPVQNKKKKVLEVERWQMCMQPGMITHSLAKRGH